MGVTDSGPERPNIHHLVLDKSDLQVGQIYHIYSKGEDGKLNKTRFWIARLKQEEKFIIIQGIEFNAGEYAADKFTNFVNIFGEFFFTPKGIYPRAEDQKEPVFENEHFFQYTGLYAKSEEPIVDYSELKRAREFTQKLNIIHAYYRKIFTEITERKRI